MGMSDATASPDKNARQTRDFNAPSIMVDLESYPGNGHGKGSANKEQSSALILDSQDVIERRETPPFESIHSLEDTPRDKIDAKAEMALTTKAVEETQLRETKASHNVS